MLDGLPAGAGPQVPLGHICGLAGPVHEDLVPGLALLGTTPRHLLVPLFRELEGLVHIDDGSAVVEELVVNNLFGMELLRNSVTDYDPDALEAVDRQASSVRSCVSLNQIRANLSWDFQIACVQVPLLALRDIRMPISDHRSANASRNVRP